MPKKEAKQEIWKTAGCCALCALGVYTALQFLAAVLVAREAVGEAQAPALVLAAAGISAVVGVLVMGRACRTKRMLLGAGCGLGLGLVVALGAVIGGTLPESGKQFAGIVAAAVGGGVLAAAAGGGTRGPQRRKRRCGGGWRLHNAAERARGRGQGEKTCCEK